MRTRALAVLALLCSSLLSAQTVPHPLPASGLEWRQPAMPLQYWDATSRRAAAFGRQDGKFEAWVWPIKVLHGFRLEFRQEGMPEPVRGEAWLSEVITRPESTTLVYVHPKFVVRETVWAAPNDPALIVFFDVDSDKPLNITAKFVPDCKPMWPASLGGQHSWWIAEDKAFGLGDALEQHVALIGSPAVAAYTDFTDHSLIGGEMLLGMRVTPEQAKAGLAPLVISLGMSGQKEAEAVYRNTIQNLGTWYAQKAADWKDFLARTTRIETPDPVLNRAWQWGKVAMHSGWVCTPVPGNEGVGTGDRAGCGMVAGYGPAGDGERPGFAWWFGGDGLLATWAMEDYGDVDGALQELRFLRNRQNAEGKVMHEMVQSVGLVDWFKDFHFAYMHADTTPMYLYSLGQYWQRTGDRKFLAEFWPSAKKAFEWCVSVTDADGLMDNTKAGLGAIEVGVLRGKVTKDIYLEGFWVGGLQQMSEMAQALGDKQLSEDAGARLKKAVASLEENWWDPQQKYFAFGITAQGERAMMPGNWPAVLAALAPEPVWHGSSTRGRGSETRATPSYPELEMERLARPDLASDWGSRGLSDQSPLYDPVSYNNGTVWPYANTFVSWAQYRWGLPLAGYASLHDTANLTGIQSPGYMPEHMNGTFFEPGERSVPHQLFSTVGVIEPLMRGLAGIEVHGSQVTLAPRPPANWPFFRVDDIAVPGGSLSYELRQSAGRWDLRLSYQGAAPPTVDVTAALPAGARVRRVQVGGKAVSYKTGAVGADVVVSGLRVARLSGGPVELVIDYEGGVAVMAPVATPHPGERSSSLKVLEATAAGEHELGLRVAGAGGRTYRLRLLMANTRRQQMGAGFTEVRPMVDAADVKVLPGLDAVELEIPFSGAGYVTREIRLRW